MKTYSKAPDEVAQRATALISKYYPDLFMVGIKIDYVSVSTDEEDGVALALHGYPCLAVVRIVSAKDRAKKNGDAEITIDEERYNDMTEKERDALIDHELYHLEVQKNKKGRPKLDCNGRPKLQMRKHDADFGWFAEIAHRHGKHSMECKQAKQLVLAGKQTYFQFAITNSEEKVDAEATLA